MDTIHIIDRITKEQIEEEVYGTFFLRQLYGQRARLRWLLPFLCRLSGFSRLFGWWQRCSWTRKKVAPFIAQYKIDPSEFVKPVDAFTSFNDFFIREFKLGARPQVPGHDRATLPADARYLAFDNIAACDGFVVKGKKFSLETLLGDPVLAKRYREGSMVIARLCPTDYHRFHFPCSGIPGPARLINGPLYSVSPLALRRNIHILAENKRVITEVQTKRFGTLMYIEVGATNVGSIHQTYEPGIPHAKGDEKGYFSFGGSTVILLFEPGAIALDQDLLAATRRGLETRGLLGQSLGAALPR